MFDFTLYFLGLSAKVVKKYEIEKKFSIFFL